MQTQEKDTVVGHLKTSFDTAVGAYLVDFRGCNCAQLTQMRGKLREANSSLEVVKNTLAKRALSGSNGVGEKLSSYFEGPTAIVWAKKDPVQPAKIIVDFAKGREKFQIKAGLLDGVVISAAEIDALSRMPSREELQARLLGLINAAVAQVLRVMNAPATQLVRVLEAWRGEMEKTAEKKAEQKEAE